MREGDAPKPTKEQKEISAMTTEEWNTYFSGHWNFAGAKQEGHLAMFPEEFFTVKEILSPEKIRLSNGLTVKLIGIKSDPFTHDTAVGYLTEKIKGKRIFMKYDKLRHHIYSLRMSLRFLPIMNAHLP
jgi:hypothetical protein